MDSGNEQIRMFHSANYPVSVVNLQILKRPW